MRDFYDVFKKNIKERGRHLIGVFPTNENPGEHFIYSIGNTLGKPPLPELLLVGGSGPPFGHFLNLLSEEMIKRGRPFYHGERVRLGVMPVVTLEANDLARAEYACHAGRYLQTEKYPLLQVVICDKEGRMPWDPDCDPGYAELPILTDNPSREDRGLPLSEKN